VHREIDFVVPPGPILQDGVALRGIGRSGLSPAATLLTLDLKLGDRVLELVGARHLDEFGLGLVVTVELHESGGLHQGELSGVQCGHGLLGVDGHPSRSNRVLSRRQAFGHLGRRNAVEQKLIDATGALGFGQRRPVIIGDDLFDDALGALRGFVAVDGADVDRDRGQPDLAGCLDAALTFAYDGLVLAVDAYRQDRVEHSVLLDGGQEVGVEAGVEADVVLDLDGGGVQVDELGSGGGHWGVPFLERACCL
jgi:hypothetical protein